MTLSLSQRVIDLACSIQQIPAPTFAEAQRSLYVERCFSDAGLADVSRDSLGNVYARITGKSSAPPLVVTAHQDTVFPLTTDLTLHRTADKIFGAGLGDNSLGVAALISLAWTINNPLRDIWLVANVCEEGLGNLTGMKAVVDRFADKALAYIVLEGMALGQVYHRGLGVQRYRITVQTNGGHSWIDYGKPSAIHTLAELVVQLNHLPVPVQPRTSLNVGVIQGGTSVNTIAAEASLELDLRSEDSAELTRLSSLVETLVSQLPQTTSQPVRATAEVIGLRPAGQIPADHPLVKLAIACLQEQGLPAFLNIGSTDANYPLSLGLPTVCVGVCTGGGAHTTGEFIHTTPLKLGLAQLKRLVVTACSQLG